MKLVFTEYLASLKERGELDVIMPDLLSEYGFTVISRPAIGTRQYGVDVAAVGRDSDGVQKLFLLSIKPGDLKRSGWDKGEQSLRASLNEIKDVYVRNHVPSRFNELPVVIVLCIGGDLHKDIRETVVAYMKANTNEGIMYELWNGDRLAGMLLSGILREKALPSTWQSDLRKSVAMVDEPDVSFAHYCRFAARIAERCKPNKPARLTAVRQIYLSLWTLYVWAREAGNIEAAYLSSERAVLMSWSLASECLTGKSKAARQLDEAFTRIVVLHNTIADDYLTTYVEPRAGTAHALTSAVPSPWSLDVNLRLFDIVGRIGLRGHWQLHLANRLDLENKGEDGEEIWKKLRANAKLLADVIQNNPALCTPIKDSQAIDINIACLVLHKLGCAQLVQNWIQQIARATVYAYRSNGAYPCVFNDHRGLIDHPREGDQYQREATVGSLLLPTLAVWASVTEDIETLDLLADFACNDYKHSTLQIWYPGSDTEEHLYRGSANHGLASHGFRIANDPESVLAPIRQECKKSDAFESLSPLKYSLWPLLILASRHHRVPVPPHFWPLEASAHDS